MKRLTITFKDNSNVVYKMRDTVSHMFYFQCHSKLNMKSAVLQKYPLKSNEPIYLFGEPEESKK